MGIPIVIDSAGEFSEKHRKWLMSLIASSSDRTIPHSVGVAALETALKYPNFLKREDAAIISKFRFPFIDCIDKKIDKSVNRKI